MGAAQTSAVAPAPAAGAGAAPAPLPPPPLHVDAQALVTIAVNSVATCCCVALADCAARRRRRRGDAARYVQEDAEVAAARDGWRRARGDARRAVAAAEQRVAAFRRAADEAYAAGEQAAFRFAEHRADTMQCPEHDSVVNRLDPGIVGFDVRSAPPSAVPADGLTPGDPPLAPPADGGASDGTGTAVALDETLGVSTWRPALRSALTEVQLGASSRLRAHAQRRTPPPDDDAPELRACPIRSSFTDALKLRTVREYVVIIDRSHSMSFDDGDGQSRWLNAELALHAIVEAAMRCDPNGVDLYFFDHRHVCVPAVRSVGEVSRQFAQNPPRGGTDLAAVLAAAFRRHFTTRQDGHGTSMLVITDGSPTEYGGDGVVGGQLAPGMDGEEAVKRVIRGAANDARLQSEAELNVTFLQIGDDGEAAEFLRVLDDDLKGDGCQYDIVDVVSPAQLQRGFVDAVSGSVA